jgi:DNA recombination-dependent growth factor C
MRISDTKETVAINSVLAKNCLAPCSSKEPQDEGWLADVYRHSSTVRQAQRASQRMLERLKRHQASKVKSQS